MKIAVILMWALLEHKNIKKLLFPVSFLGLYPRTPNLGLLTLQAAVFVSIWSMECRLEA